ncbi:sensor histidine kinase [Bifidobacterium eulemuris]|uniref:Histidine kinase n=1 Tax=Bifidobacterium eulemuris TaxID=1765219 RepID=A0A261FYJ5_9BIFI|nr:hypothetical protein [Bifidobacterium eulemuris]OZG64249.1 hypothetical protein BEUL_2210 [Bifidobacterium eulemuris]QOL32824.1 hypothetical protein BE0216_10550 [Bifidobacterium eulemuris]
MTSPQPHHHTLPSISRWISFHLPFITHRWIAAFALASCALNIIVSFAAVHLTNPTAMQMTSPAIPYLLFMHVCVLSIALLPVAGSCTTIIVWCVGVLQPTAATGMPFTLIFSVCLAIAALEYCMEPAGFPTAIVAGIIAALGTSVERIDSSELVPSHEPMNLMPITVPLFLCVALFAHLLTRKEQLDALGNALRRKSDNEQTSRLLHDSISNEVTDAMLLLDDAMGTAQDEHASLRIQQARTHLQQAHAHTHELIALLDSDMKDAEAATTAGFSRWDFALAGPASPASHRADAANRISRDDLLAVFQRIEGQQTKAFTSLGFDGEILLPHSLACAHYASDTVHLLQGLFNECCANVRKHADPRYGYVISIESESNRFLLRVKDVPLHEKDSSSGDHIGNAHPSASIGLRLHTGLRRYEAELRAIGGTLTTQDENGFWTLEASIPAIR